MSELDRQIMIKITLDGKDLKATLDTSDKQVQDLITHIHNLGPSFDGVNVTVNDLKTRIADVTAQIKNYGAQWGVSNDTILNSGSVQSTHLKNLQAQLQTLKAKLIELGGASGAYEPLIQEALKYNLVNNESIQSISEYIQAQGLSINVITQTVQALDAEIKTLGVNSVAWKEKMTTSTMLKASMNSMIAQQSGMNSTVRAGVPGLSSMNMAMMQFGYGLNDAQMLLVNFRMGMMGISNNIPMLVQNFVQAKNAAGEGTSMMKLLTASIMGGGGLIIAINGLMFLLNVLPSLFADSTKEIKELTETMGDDEKKVRTQQIEFQKLIGILNNLNNTEKLRGEAYDELKEKYPEYISFLKSEKDETEKIAEALEKGNAQFSLKIKLAASERILKEYYEQAVDGEYRLQELQKIKEETQKQFDAGNKSRGFSLQQIDKEITSLTKKRGDALEHIQEIMQKIVDLNSKILKDGSKGGGDPEFEKATKELRLAQDHAIAMAEIEGKSDAEILQMKKENLIARINTYEKYKQDVTALVNNLVETELKIKKEAQVPLIKIEEETEDIILGDIKNAADYKDELNQSQLDRWYASEDQKLQAYENYSDLKTVLDEEYASKKEEIDEKVKERNLATLSQTVGEMAGLFGEQTVAYKVLATAQAIIDTYRAANVALASAPPPWNFIAMAGVIAAGLKNVSTIIATKVEQPQIKERRGYKHGGILKKGESGFIEGEGVEIIAPEEDFKTYAGQLVRQAIIEANNQIIIQSPGNSSELSNEVKQLRTDIKYLLENPVPSVAYLDDREAKRIYNTGNAARRKSGI